MGSDFAQQIRLCAAALAAGAPLPLATAFRGQLEQARLDGSHESLARLDALLAQLRQAGKLALDRLSATEVGNGFLAAVCAAVGLGMQRAHGASVEWLDRASAQGRGIELPDDLASRAVGLHLGLGLLPLQALVHFQPEGAGGYTCVEYRSHVRGVLQGRALADERGTDQRALGAALLAAGTTGVAPDGGFAYLEEVHALKPDSSLESLTRLQLLLNQLAPTAEAMGARFINEPAHQNFVRWAGFYLGMTAALLARVPIKWLNHLELCQLQPDVPFDFITSQAAVVDGNKLHLPLRIVIAALQRDPEHGDLGAWARMIDESAENRLIPLERPRRPALDLNKHWLAALEAAGYQAAFAMGQLADGNTVSPVLLQGQPDGKMLVRDFSLYGDAESGMRAIDESMAHNPDKLPFQVSAMDSFANLPTGRCDAVSIRLRVYGGGLLSGRKPLQLDLACPYRAATDARGFGILPPVLMHCDAGLEPQALAFGFFKGVDRYKFQDFTWRRYEAPARPDLN